jgi:hypothetical protein
MRVDGGRRVTRRAYHWGYPYYYAYGYSYRYPSYYRYTAIPTTTGDTGRRGDATASSTHLGGGPGRDRWAQG